MKHIFIINPVAGKGKIQDKLKEDIHQTLRDKEIDYEVYVTKFKGDVENYIANKCKENIQIVFYACGGDGTLHEVINAAIKYDNASVGVMPTGSGNDFIKNFSNYGNFSDIKSQIEGDIVEIDVLKVNDVYAATVLNIGLDADVAFNMHKFKKIPFIKGSTSYYLAIIYCLFSKLGKYLEVKTDKNVIKGTFLIGVIANGQYYGSGYNCAPKAEINDEILDLCFVENISRTKILSLLGSYKKGNHLEDPKINKYVTYDKIKQANIILSEPTNVCMDGEKYTFSTINVTTEKNSLRFRLPKGVQIKSVKKETVHFWLSIKKNRLYLHQ